MFFFLVRIKQPTNDITVILVNNSTPPVTSNTISNKDIPLVLLWPEGSIVVVTAGVINCDDLLLSIDGITTITQDQYNNNNIITILLTYTVILTNKGRWCYMDYCSFKSMIYNSTQF